MFVQFKHPGNIFLVLGVLILAASACAPTSEVETSEPDQAAIWEAWQNSPHADTYDLEKGPNTYCSRCHSPQNWDPKAIVDPPPNCVSCKFSFESSPRQAVGNKLIPESEWLNIDCEICHQVSNGVADPEVTWLDTSTGTYEQVASNSTICEKCHTDTDTLRHHRTLGTSSHKDFGCSDCHDAHSTTASCSAANCHPDALTQENPIPGHDSNHLSVTCVACHDTSGLEVGPQEDGIWVTWRTTELLGRENTEPYQSHDLVLAVACVRCHFAGNPWQLNPDVEEISH
jgi:hypothetical protein